ncbi:MAG: hypothetical protein JOZ72_10140 [Alphaproteobacteria bacterium]|nr:hypothetical protein [Alphaproteobacteria bacterium]
MQIFVAMPLGEKEIPNLRLAITKAVAQAGFKCHFPNENARHGTIIEDIMDQISRSAAVIAEISHRNPNVIWEYGWASALGKPVIPITTTTEAFFFDTIHRRAIVYDPKRLMGSLVQELTRWCENLRVDGPEFPPVQLVHSKTYSGASSALFGLNSLTNTEFGFFELMKRTRSHFFAAAQNHHFLVNNMKQLKSALRSFFRRGASDKRFDLLMCDPKSDFGVKTWQALSLPQYANHLKQAAEVFDELAVWARSQSSIGDRFRLRKVPLVPVSMNFVDPDAPNGLLVMTPTFLKSENRARHSIIVSKLNSAQIFMQYWSWADSLFTLYEAGSPPAKKGPKKRPGARRA